MLLLLVLGLGLGVAKMEGGTAATGRKMQCRRDTRPSAMSTKSVGWT